MVPAPHLGVLGRTRVLSSQGVEAGRCKVWEVRELEYPLLLRGLPSDHEYVVDFDIQIRWFRDLVLHSEVFQLKRHLGSAGIGLIAREDCLYAGVRSGVVGFAWGMEPRMFDFLRRVGYTA